MWVSLSKDRVYRNPRPKPSSRSRALNDPGTVAEVIWRPQALRDLEAIEAYYEEVAPDFAALFVVGAFEKVRRLADFPNAGRMVPEIGDASIREVIYRQYRIIYVVAEGSVEVLTVYHSARPFGTLG